MITNFEDITPDLSEEELQFKDEVAKILSELISSKTVKQSEIANAINYKLASVHGPDSISITPTRLRKYFNYFRTNGVIAIIATSNGCYITSNKEEIEKQIISLEERARQINKAANGMKKFLI